MTNQAADLVAPRRRALFRSAWAARPLHASRGLLVVAAILLTSRQEVFAQPERVAEPTGPAAATSDSASPAADRPVEDADVVQQEQQAVARAIEEVAEAVVQIRTVGGLEQVEGKQVAAGPTTGTIVRSDGYIVSSAYGFVQQPASILVRLPAGNFVPAKLVGRDESRMLVLLKVDVDESLPTAEATPTSEIAPGWRTAALGRTFDAERVNVSVGVVSAVGRMHGRALQTDAAVSAANYGGPLIDLYGRALGIIVPFAPEQGGADAPSVLAGTQFYDSGIGFATPLEDILANLDRWIAEGDLNRGRLGIGLVQGNAHALPAEISAVWPQSPAAAAGWKPGDTIVAVEGELIESQTQLRMAIVPRYAGDRLRVTLRRADKQLETVVTLAAELPKYRPAFLGILPRRSDSTEELIVEQLWPGSPAEAAGIRAEDRIEKIDEQQVNSRADAVGALGSRMPGDSVQVTFEQNNESLAVEVELAKLPNEILSAADAPSRGETTLRQPAAALELQSIKLPDLPHESWYYQPGEVAGSPGMLVILASVGEDETEAIAAAWRQVCDRRGLVLLIASPGEGRAWEEEDLRYLQRILTLTRLRFSVDPTRIVLAGDKKSGQLAVIAALRGRGLASGVVCTEAPLPRSFTLPATTPGRRVAFLCISGQQSPFEILIEKDVQQLSEAGYSATHLTPPKSPELVAPSGALQQQVARWIDGLDRF